MTHVAHDDMTKEVVQTPLPSQNVIVSSTPKTMQHVMAQDTAPQVVAQVTLASTPRAQQTPSSSSRSLTSTNTIKTSLCEIYGADTPNSFSVFALFSQIDDPLTFEEVVEDEVWAQAMDEEKECIEKIQTWELIDVRNDKYVINVKCI